MSSINNINPFDKQSGAATIMEPKKLMLLFAGITLFAVIIAKMSVAGAGILMALIFGSVYMYKLFSNPLIGYYTAIALNFVILGMTRYVQGLPLGFAIDGILILSLLSIIFTRFKERVDWTAAKQPLTLFSIIWLGYCIFQIVNPEAQSIEAWIASRGMGFYFFYFVVLTFMLIRDNKKLDIYLYVWGIFSLLATLKGMMQLIIGLDPYEQAWLDAGAFETHLLFGKLRIFSFFSDAGQFGANQGYTGVVFIIFSMTKKGLEKIFFLTVAILGLYGMMISGTRGAISVPLAGFMTFFVLRKNVKIITAGLILVVGVFIFFKYTTIGNGNYQIRRMRGAFDPNNKSLKVRLDNQKKFKAYLATRPFGGGLGHAGDKAQRFLPHSFLANVATDSWYVLIWAELGVVGLTMHLFFLFFVIGRASYMVMFRIRDPITKLKMSALISGMAGIMVASYGNQIFGSMPTSLVMYASMAVMSMPEVFERKEYRDETKTLKEPKNIYLT